MGVIHLKVQARRFIISLFVQKKCIKGKKDRLSFLLIDNNARQEVSSGFRLASSKLLLCATTSDPQVYKCLGAGAIIPEQSQAGEVLRLAEGMSKVR